MGLEIRQNFGYLPDLPDARDWKYSERLAAGEEKPPPVLPPKFIVPKLSTIPVFDQGELGSCVGCAVGSLHAYERKVVPRSKLQIYYEARRLIGMENVDSGAYIRDAIKVIATLGAGRETWWPYDVSKFTEDPPIKVDRDALKRRIFSYWSLEGRDEYRACLASGHPIVLGSMLYSNFMSWQTWDHGIITLPTSRNYPVGGHAYLVVGYDTNFKTSEWAQNRMMAGFPAAQVPDDVYICRNSWGSEWGYRGDFAVDARFIDLLAFTDDAWTIRKVRDPASGATQ